MFFSSEAAIWGVRHAQTMAPSGGRPHKSTCAFICGDGWGGRPPALEVATPLPPSLQILERPLLFISACYFVSVRRAYLRRLSIFNNNSVAIGEFVTESLQQRWKRVSGSTVLAGSGHCCEFLSSAICESVIRLGTVHIVWNSWQGHYSYQFQTDRVRSQDPIPSLVFGTASVFNL